MNKLLLSICLSISFMGNLIYSQDVNRKGFYLGPGITYNIGSINLSENNRAIRGVSLPNFNSLGGGLILNYQFEKVFLQTELVYNNKEAIDSDFVSVDTNPYKSGLTASFSYINVPFLVGYNFTNSDLIPYGILGVKVGLATKNELSLEFEEGTPSFIPQKQPITSWDTNDIGIIAELGIKKYMANKGFAAFSVRYTGSERTYFLNKGLMTGGAANLGTRMLSGSLSYMFSL